MTESEKVSGETSEMMEMLNKLMLKMEENNATLKKDIADLHKELTNKVDRYNDELTKSKAEFTKSFAKLEDGTAKVEKDLEKKVQYDKQVESINAAPRNSGIENEYARPHAASIRPYKIGSYYNPYKYGIENEYARPHAVSIRPYKICHSPAERRRISIEKQYGFSFGDNSDAPMKNEKFIAKIVMEYAKEYDIEYWLENITEGQKNRCGILPTRFENALKI